jgi:hypothetical protein
MGNKQSLPPPPKPIHLPTIHVAPLPNIKINIPKVNLSTIHIPKPQPIHLPPPVKIPPLKDLVKQIPIISKSYTIPPFKVAVPVHINIDIKGLPPLHVNNPVVSVPALKTPVIPPPKKPEIDMHALKQSLGIIAGVVSLNPIGKVLVTGVMAIADVASNGKASDFVNDGHKINSTLNFLPGGELMQQVANDASKGKSGDALTKYVPDPKKMIMEDVIAVGKTVVTDPKNVINTTKSVINHNIKSIENSADVKIIKTALHTVAPVKPSITKVVVDKVKEVTKPISIVALHTVAPVASVLKPSIAKVIVDIVTKPIERVAQSVERVTQPLRPEIIQKPLQPVPISDLVTAPNFSQKNPVASLPVVSIPIIPALRSTVASPVSIPPLGTSTLQLLSAPVVTNTQPDLTMPLIGLGVLSLLIFL